MIRFGLCCLFKEQPIKFRHATATNIKKLSANDQIDKLSDLCLDNVKSLLQAVQKVNELGIKSFRIMTPLLPLYTHPEVGYSLQQLRSNDAIVDLFTEIREYKQQHDIRLSFHPDQFIVLNSPRAEVVESAVKELNYQAMLAEMVDADVINIHAGGVYGDKENASIRFIKNFKLLDDAVKNRLTIENDDKNYTPDDLNKISEETGVPLVYDVHHHRCNPDGLSVEEATDLSVKSWQRVGREAYFHISSPKLGWKSSKPSAHSDFIDVNDFPEYWKALNIDFTVDVEAKAKELAVMKLKKELML